MPRSLRLSGESEEAFQQRAEAAARVARELLDACLQNETVRAYLADPEIPQWSLESLKRNPIVRVEYEEALAIGCIGECLHATQNKHWGAGPDILPLQVDDWMYPDRITYIYKPHSRYNRRFEQRQQMKALLGKKRPLVERARRESLADFLAGLTGAEAWAIERILCLVTMRFWRAARGTRFVTLPPVRHQSELPLGE